MGGGNRGILFKRQREEGNEKQSLNGIPKAVLIYFHGVVFITFHLFFPVFRLWRALLNKRQPSFLERIFFPSCRSFVGNNALKAT